LRPAKIYDRPARDLGAGHFTAGLAASKKKRSVNLENLSDGLVLITIGVVVVLCILMILGLSVEGIVWFDNFMRTRQKLRQEAREPDPDKTLPDEVAAIGLALHQYYLEQIVDPGLQKIEKKRSTVWSSSGRLEIMAARGRLTGRHK